MDAHVVAISMSNTDRHSVPHADNVDLGTACGKYFRVSVMAITDPGEQQYQQQLGMGIGCLHSIFGNECTMQACNRDTTLHVILAQIMRMCLWDQPCTYRHCFFDRVLTWLPPLPLQVTPTSSRPCPPIKLLACCVFLV